MLDLNELRAAFAAHLSADPLRFSMDKALAHACQLAYQRGLEDGAKNGTRPRDVDFRSLLAAVVEQLEDRNSGHVDAPGHSHMVPGIWDNHNGNLSGKQCAWCALWNQAKSSLGSVTVVEEQP